MSSYQARKAEVKAAYELAKQNDKRAIWWKQAAQAVARGDVRYLEQIQRAFENAKHHEDARNVGVLIEIIKE